MKMTPSQAANAKDPLHWTMRVGGVLVILLSAFLLMKNVAYGIGDDLFCAFSLGLGVVAFVASWLPHR